MSGNSIVDYVFNYIHSVFEMVIEILEFLYINFCLCYTQSDNKGKYAKNYIDQF